MIDKELLESYQKGFKDELRGLFDDFYLEIGNEMLARAYSLGGLHVIVGDDVRSVDYLSDEEILKMIKE